MKRLLLLCAITVLIAVFPIYSHAYGKEPSDWARPIIEEIREAGMVDESILGDYQSEMNRKDFAYLAVVIYEAMTGRTTEVGNASFLDSRDEYVLRAKNAKLVDGYPDGSYKPYKSMNRAEIAKLFINVLEKADTNLNTKSLKVFADDFDIPLWAKEPVYAAKAFNIVEGVGGNNFAPNDVATREQAFVMFYRIYQKHVVKSSKARTFNNLEVGAMAPDFNLSDQFNTTYNLREINKMTLLVFLTSYDKLSLDLIDLINKNYDTVSKKIEVIGVLTDTKDISFKIKTFAKQIGTKFPLLIDSDGIVAEKYSVVNRPCTFVIDGNKQVAEIQLGQFDRNYLLSLAK